MPKLCRYCNEPMKETVLTDYLNPTREYHEPIPVYSCTNPKCEHMPYFFRYDHVNPPEKSASFQVIHLGKIGNRVVREWYCPFCDNPVEILDQVYYIWNCPNCYHLASSGVTFRYYPITKETENTVEWDENAELIEERHCGTCWDPYLPPESDDDQEDD